MFYQKSILLSFLGISVAGAAHAGLRKSDTNFNSALAGVSSTTKRREGDRSLWEDDICDYDCECKGSPKNHCFKLNCDAVGFCSTDQGNCNDNRNDECDNNNRGGSCNPSRTEESRRGDTYEFKREGSSHRICIDSNNRKYEYGKYELRDDDDAHDCAQACVSKPHVDTVDDLVGYDWNCKESLCHCLYDNGRLSGSDRSDFRSYDKGNNGSGSVDGTQSEDNWQCYKLDNVDRGGFCNPSRTEESRNGDRYEFERVGSSDRICNDSRDRQHEYGKYRLSEDDDADDCAQACVNYPAKSTLEHLVGYDWNCRESRCHCLYDNGRLSGSERSDFSSFDRGNSGSGSVDNTEREFDWRCYRLDDVRNSMGGPRM